MSTPAAATPPVNIESVRLAIAQLYGQSETTTAHSAVSDWLTEVKCSAAAWELLWLLLMPDKSDMERFLGATFLRDKMREQWRELSADDIPELKSRLLDITFGCYGNGVLYAAPLIESVAVLVVQTCCDLWTDAVDDLTRSCQSMNDQILGARLLLSLLTELPQQLIKCHIAARQQARVKLHLVQHVPQMLEMVLTLLRQTPDDLVSSKCMDLLAVWVDLDITADKIFPIIDLVLVPFVDSPALVVATLDMMERVVGSHSINHHPSVVLQLTERVLTLQPFIAKFSSSGDPDVLTALGNVFKNLAMSHSNVYVSALGGVDNFDANAAEMAQRLVSAVLELSSVPGRYPNDETVSELTFGVWYSIQDDCLALDKVACERVKGKLQPVYMKLLSAMLHKSMFPAQPGDMDADDAEMFRKYRQDIQDFYTYTQNLMGDYILSTFIVYMHWAVVRVRDDSSQWPALEAVLHALAALGENHVVGESDELAPVDNMRTVLLTLPDIPYGDNVRLMEAAFKLIDACSCMFDLYPSCLQPLVPMLVAGLWRPQLTLATTMALKDICQDAPRAIAPHALTVLATCNDVLTRGTVTGRERVRLMYVVGALIGHVTDTQQRAQFLQALVEPSVEQFKQQLPAATTEQKPGVFGQLVVQMNGFTSLAAGLAASDAFSTSSAADCQELPDDEDRVSCQPLLHALLTELLPSLHLLATAATHDEHVAESMCSFISRCLLSSSDCQPSQEVFTSCLHVLSTLYSREPHHQVINVIQKLLVLPLQSECGLLLSSAFQQVCAASYNYFNADPLKYPEAVAHFFQLLATTLRKHFAYIAVLQEQHMSLIQLACSCVQQRDRHVVKNTCDFLCKFVDASRSCTRLNRCLMERGSNLVSALLLAIGGCVPRDSIQYIADVLAAMVRGCAGQLSQWLRHLLAQPDFPSHRVSEQQKKVFIEHVLQGLRDRNLLRSHVMHFCWQCRGLEGTSHVISPGPGHTS